mgnify:FL=1
MTLGRGCQRRLQALLQVQSLTLQSSLFGLAPAAGQARADGPVGAGGARAVRAAGLDAPVAQGAAGRAALRTSAAATALWGAAAAAASAAAAAAAATAATV